MSKMILHANFEKRVLLKKKDKVEDINFFLIVKGCKNIQYAASFDLSKAGKWGENITDRVQSFALKRRKTDFRLEAALTFLDGSKKVLTDKSFSLYVSNDKNEDIKQHFSLLCFQLPERVAGDIRWHWFDSDIDDCGLALHLLNVHLFCLEEASIVCDKKS